MELVRVLRAKAVEQAGKDGDQDGDRNDKQTCFRLVYTTVGACATLDEVVGQVSEHRQNEEADDDLTGGDADAPGVSYALEGEESMSH